MSDAENWCREQWEHLKREELRSVALNNIRDHLNSLPPVEASHKVKLLELPRIFECLESSDQKQIDTACEVLELCFANLSIGYVAEMARDNILKALLHENVTARQMAINELHRTVCLNNKPIPLPESMDIAVAVVKCIADQELKVGVKAMDIVCREPWLRYPQLVAEINNILAGDTSNRCKAYEVIVNIAKTSPENLKSCVETGFLQKLIAELKTSDILLQLNILELLANLATAPHGLSFLVENHILKELAQLLTTLDHNLLANILLPGLMRFFGNIAHMYPMEIFNNFPTIVTALFETIKANNTSTLPTALDTLAFVGSTIEGKLALGALGHIFTSSLADIGSYIKNAPTEIRIRALNCIQRLISVRDNLLALPQEPVEQRVVLMTREWFREVSERPPSMEVLFGICKNPFPDLKLAALGCLGGICQHPWGEELVKETPGLLEFLLDRTVDHEKESKHVKYEIVKVLSVSNIFDVDVLLRLKAYAEEGPFYVQGIMEVAIEGE